MVNLNATIFNLKSLIILGIAAALVASGSAYSFGLLTNQNNMNTSGIIANVNMGVYSDAACTKSITSVNWGVCYPGSPYTAVVYVKNLGTVNTTFTIQTSGWNPSAASSDITLSSDYTGRTIAAGTSLKVTLTLTVASSIKDITSFSFNIGIVSQG